MSVEGVCCCRVVRRSEQNCRPLNNTTDAELLQMLYLCCDCYQRCVEVQKDFYIWSVTVGSQKVVDNSRRSKYKRKWMYRW